MKKKLYVFYDVTAQECNEPFTANNDGVALRNFSVALAKQSPDFQAEFELHCIGEIDMETMVFVTEECPREVKVVLDEYAVEGSS